MGQYHHVVNLDKKEYLDNYMFGSGAKLLEQHGYASVSSALHLLLSASSGRGGGDYRARNSDGFVGRWAGDRIAIIGDYAESDDVPGVDARAIYESLEESYTNISADLAELMEQEFEVLYTGSGWKNVLEISDCIEGYKHSSLGRRQERQIHVDEHTFPVSKVREALSRWIEKERPNLRSFEPPTWEELDLNPDQIDGLAPLTYLD